MFPSSPITCESRGCQLFHTALTLGLLLQVFVFVFVFVFGVWIHMAATSLTMQRWALDLVINLLTSLC